MEEKKRLRVYKVIMLVVLVAFVTFLITSIGMYQYFTNGDGIRNAMISTDTGSDDIADTLDKYKVLIDKYYLGEEVDDETLKEGAIKGYIEALGDPYTEYISKEDMEDYMDDTMGNFVGIGVYMVKDTETNQIMVLSPIKNSPAARRLYSRSRWKCLHRR